MAFLAAFVDEELQLRFGLNASGRHRHAEAFAERQNCPHDGPRRNVIRQAPDERLIELDLVERKRMQCGQGRIARSQSFT